MPTLEAQTDLIKPVSDALGPSGSLPLISLIVVVILLIIAGKMVLLPSLSLLAQIAQSFDRTTERLKELEAAFSKRENQTNTENHVCQSAPHAQ